MAGLTVGAESHVWQGIVIGCKSQHNFCVYTSLLLSAALASLESLVLEDILNAHLEGGGDMHGFSATQFRIVMKGLLESKSGAVSWEKLVDDESVGEEALLAMVEANLLAYREPSELALDIPPAAYGSYMAVATAFLPVHLHCMRKVAGDATFSNPK